ncbi:MAG: selenocysteine-specific translation elongation factor, partial [Chloroflexota bacterium]|nr:selenocysteine-specific translation elongation factor [Chloroflexota bacterium]
GFAWMALSDGCEVSIVDVPGHEIFVNNMLAGVGGIDLALLVVAADESVMPQTREHLAILDLLNVSRGLVAVTKRDLVDEEWLELVTAEVQEVLEGTTLEGVPIIPVSATTGDGLPELTATVEALLQDTRSRKDLGRPRLALDRAFTMSGFGTVVTGTLVDGTLSVGQEVEVLPQRLSSRIRGLQSHKRKLETVPPGTRVAANLVGLSQDEIQRGDVLTVPGWLTPTDAVDVHLRVIEDVPRPLRHNMLLTVHTGSSEALARLRLLERQRAEPGESVWAQLKFESPVAVVKDDFFVVRSNRATLGGGSVVDTHARRHRRNHQPTLDRLTMMEQGTAQDILLNTIERSEPADVDELPSRANMEASVVRSEIEEMAGNGDVVLLRSGKSVYTKGGWGELERKARIFLKRYHETYPLRKGAPKEELRSRIGGSTAAVFPEVLRVLQDNGAVVEDGPVVYLTGHSRKLTEAQELVVQDYLATLEAQPFSPPTEPVPDGEILALLVDEGRVVRAGDTVVFAASAYRKMADGVVEHIRTTGPITVGDVRDMFGTSRKYALSLLEQLDRERVTRREGDGRVLR